MVALCVYGHPAGGRHKMLVHVALSGTAEPVSGYTHVERAAIAAGCASGEHRIPIGRLARAPIILTNDMLCWIVGFEPRSGFLGHCLGVFQVIHVALGTRPCNLTSWLVTYMKFPSTRRSLRVVVSRAPTAVILCYRA